MAWFAYDIDEYDADTMHLSPAEDGAYMRLLRFYYKTRLPLPDNDRALASIARMSVDEWEAIKETIRAFFKSRRGKLHQKRCDKELDREDALSRKRSERAKNAAEKRHGKTKTYLLPASPEHLPSMTVTLPGDATRPDQTIQDKKELPPKPPKGGDDDPEFEFWWSGYPEKVGKGAARKAYRKARLKADAAALLRGVTAYKATKPADRPWCNPGTWLNQERWLDAPAKTEPLPAYTASLLDEEYRQMGVES